METKLRQQSRNADGTTGSSFCFKGCSEERWSTQIDARRSNDRQNTFDLEATEHRQNQRSIISNASAEICEQVDAKSPASEPRSAAAKRAEPDDDKCFADQPERSAVNAMAISSAEQAHGTSTAHIAGTCSHQLGFMLRGARRPPDEH